MLALCMCVYVFWQAFSVPAPLFIRQSTPCFRPPERVYVFLALSLLRLPLHSKD